RREPRQELAGPAAEVQHPHARLRDQGRRDARVLSIEHLPRAGTCVRLLLEAPAGLVLPPAFLGRDRGHDARGAPGIDVGSDRRGCARAGAAAASTARPRAPGAAVAPRSSGPARTRRARTGSTAARAMLPIAP